MRATTPCRATKNSWADGPPFSYWWPLERSRRVLAELGETDEAAIQAELDLTPFDESKIESVPYEDEIRAFIKPSLRRRIVMTTHRRERATEGVGNGFKPFPKNNGKCHHATPSGQKINTPVRV